MPKGVYKRTAVTRAKMSAAHMGHPVSDETRAKQSLLMRGKACPDMLGNKNRLTHGMNDTPTNRSWKNMIQRCTNQNHAAYKNYGGRGITVCAEWLNSFKVFLEDMGERPSKDYSIDRIDNDGNYEPANCRWATRSEQQRNKRKKRPVVDYAEYLYDA